MRKFSLIIFALIVTALAAMPAMALQEATPAATPNGQVALTLERTICYGACPVYTLTIYTDGTVVYNGTEYVRSTGEATSSIDPAMVDQLIAGFEAAGYFGWDDAYTEMDATDAPTVTTSVTWSGVTKQIVHYGGDAHAPLALPFLEQWIDIAAHTDQWTGDEVAAVSGTLMESPIITLERRACNGVCPVYGLSIFRDGTVVYLGIDHVAVTGVQIAQLDNSAVEMLIHNATAAGYFGWKDEYADTPITDQATVITSVYGGDQGYKHISRYDGDPNAPIGLVRLEDKIDQAVNVDQWVKAQ